MPSERNGTRRTPPRMEGGVDEVDEEAGVEEDEVVDEVVEEGVDEVEGVDVMVVTGITGTRRNPRVCPPALVLHR